MIRTPHDVILDEPARAVRLPAVSGHVGLRPREEPFLLAVEPGLVIVRLEHGERQAATAGGLLDGARDQAVLYTPFAVIGDRAEDVLARLDEALATPDGELSARRRLGELEQHIVHKLRQPAVHACRANP